MTLIDYDAAVQAMRDQIAKKGEDYVYTKVKGGDGNTIGCTYYHPDKAGRYVMPGCIIGHWLRDVGYPSLKSLTLGLDLDDSVNGSSAWMLVSRMHQTGSAGIKFTIKAREFLHAVQCNQDDGMPWGQALQEAMAECSGIKEN